MNLRILKKLSKRAATYLPLLGDHRQQFRSEKDDNYHGLIINARKHWERTPSVHTDIMHEGGLVLTPRSRADHKHPFIKIYPGYHPRKGTIMVGAMQGYYEPEWEEETAWGALREIVAGEFTDWSAVARDDYAVPWLTRSLRTPSDVFAAADDLVAARESAER